MEDRPAMSFAATAPAYQPLTPVSPGLATSMPLVCEPIPPLPMTPPDVADIPDKAADEAALSTALQVIAAEKDALTYLGRLYESDPTARDGFTRAVSMISKTITRGGKLVVSGVGKSGKIGQKVVATMNSLGIRSTFLHPTEALHGDLGMVGEHDTLLLLTYSGLTTELLSLLRHLPPPLPLVALTSHLTPSTCPLFIARPSALSILLPCPIPHSENSTLGLPAPTISTTTALALADALALALARRLHPSPAAVFRAFHPGGAIGSTPGPPPPLKMSDLATRVADVPVARPCDPSSSGANVTALDILVAAAASPSGWVRPTEGSIVSPRQVQRLGREKGGLERGVRRLREEGVVVERGDWISVGGGSEVAEVREWVGEMRGERGGGRGRRFLRRATLLGVVDAEGGVSGVVEIEDVVGEGGVG